MIRALHCLITGTLYDYVAIMLTSIVCIFLQTKDKGLFFQTLENGTQIQLKASSKHLIEENTLVILDMSKQI